MADKKAWKQNRNPQELVVPKLAKPGDAPAAKIPNGRRPIPIRHAAFCNINGVLGLAICALDGSIPVFKPVSKVDLSTRIVQCGKELFQLDLINLTTPERMEANFKHKKDLEEMVNLLDLNLSHAKTELRESQKECLQLRAQVKGKRLPKQANKENIF
jgi:hypothetical protein